jgi:hypothetical protein
MSKCILCGEDLDTEATNLEHYVPAVAIRNFDKLLVPEKMGWALRQNYCDNSSERLLRPISSHKEWATVRVHQRCNQDASHMCQDLKYIIDHLEDIDSIPDRKFKSIIEYYAHLWGVPADDVFVELLSPKETESKYKSAASFLMYSMGWLDLCHFSVFSESLMNADNEPGVEKHWIWIGKKEVLSEAK